MVVEIVWGLMLMWPIGMSLMYRLVTVTDRKFFKLLECGTLVCLEDVRNREV